MGLAFFRTKFRPSSGDRGAIPFILKGSGLLRTSDPRAATTATPRPPPETCSVRLRKRCDARSCLDRTDPHRSAPIGVLKPADERMLKPKPADAINSND